MARWVRLGLMAWVFWTAPATLWAQYGGRDLSLSAMFGAVFFDLSDQYRGPLKVDLPPRQVWGLSVEYTVVPRLGLEFYAGFNPNDFDTPAVIGYGLDHWYLVGGLIYRFTPARTLNPYVTAGAGVTLMKPQTGGAATPLTLHFGVGTDVFGSPHWAVRVDARVFSYPFRTRDFDPVTLQDTGLDPSFDRRVWDFVIVAGVRWKP